MIAISEREQQILALVAEGLSDSEIATRLFVSRGTVKFWKARLYENLGGARNAAHAVHLGYQAGLLGVDRPEDLAVVEQAREMGYRIALVPIGGAR